MIFVTVGTTAFEGLIKAADKIDKKEDVIIQKADGVYEPQNHEFFEITHEFSKYVDRAELVITHGGAGILFELLDKGKRIIGVANEERDDQHQSDLLGELAAEGYIIWCRDLSKLSKEIAKARNFEFRKYKKPECHMAEEIIKKFA